MKWIVEAESIDDVVLGNYSICDTPLTECKDCKWFEGIGCAIRIVDDSDKPTGNDFCSFAERREE